MPARDLRGDLAFMRAFMRKHRLADDVADCENVLNVGAHLPIDRDEAALVDRDPRRLGADRLAVRTPADRDQDGVENFGRRAGRTLIGDVESVALGLDLGHFRLEQDLVVELADSLGERGDDVGVGAGHQLIHHLDHGDACAERIIDRRHLEADDAAAQDQHAFRDEAHLQRSGRIPDARIGRDEPGRDRLRAGGDDRVLEAHGPRALGGFDLQGVWRSELPPAGHDPHFALLGKTGQAARQSLDHPILPAANGRGVERGLTELDSMRAHRGRLLDDLGDVQQRLRWDAADVEADAAERLPGVDQHDILPEIGGAEGGGVAARAGAEDENVRFDIRLSAGIGRRLRSGRGRGLGRRLLDLGAAVRRGGGRRLRLFAFRVSRQQRALADLVADLDADRADHPILRRRHVHRRLVAFKRQDRVLLADAFSGRDLDLDDRHVLEVADIGKPDFLGHRRISPAIRPQSQNDAPHVLDDPRKVAHEARSRGAVDDAVIIREAKRQHQTRLERLPVPHRRHL